jgi:hypothetical protein
MLELVESQSLLTDLKRESPNSSLEKIVFFSFSLRIFSVERPTWSFQTKSLGEWLVRYQLQHLES